MLRPFRHRYYCVNVKACRYARSDHAYDEMDFRRAPFCGGVSDDGCGSPLIDGGKEPLPKVAVTMLALAPVVAVALFLGTKTLFPGPLIGVSFSDPSSSVSDGQTTVAVSLRRAPGSEGRVVVKYVTMDGTAQAGRDYSASSGVLVFSEGEHTKALSVPLLPGKIDVSQKRSFTVMLENVESRPSHVVVITPPVVDADAMGKADVLVRLVSGMSIEIADLYVTSRTRNRAARLSGIDDAARREYDASRKVLEGNLEQACRRYLEALTDLTTLERLSVVRTFENWDARLDHLDLPQQRAATRIARRHYEELARGTAARMDIWTFQLSDAIPKPPGAGGVRPGSV